MFKNLIVYRIGPHWTASLAHLQTALAKALFVPCAPTQPTALGWVPPRGHDHDPLVESVAGQWLLQLMVEHRLLPSAVVKRHTDERVAQIEHATGRKPGKKQTRELKEDTVLALLPQAFTKQQSISVWLDPVRRLVMIGTGSAARADDVITQLVRAADDLQLSPLHTVQSPAAAMAQWLTTGDPAPGFSVDRECELKAADEMKSVVRYARHALDIEEVRGHIAAGKQPTQLALTWKGRVSMVLTESMQIKKIAFVEGIFESDDAAQADRFDADAAIATGELGAMIQDLIEGLGGEPEVHGLPQAA